MAVPRLAFRTIRVRLTTAGALFITLTLLAGIVAVNSGNNLLYIVVAVLLSLLTVSGLTAYVNLRGLSASLRLPGELYAGHTATLSLDLTNRKRRIPSYLLQCEPVDGSDLVLELSPGATATLRTVFTPAERGRHPLPALTLLSEFPFGLIRRGGSFRPEGEFIVAPHPAPVPWKYLFRAERGFDGVSAPRAGTGGDWRGLRDYLPGDSLSRVEWKGWLRHRRLLTKEFETEGAARVSFSFDDVPGPGTEERLSQLTWLVRTSLRRGGAVGLVLPGEAIPPGVGAAHRRRLITALALFGKNDALPSD